MKVNEKGRLILFMLICVAGISSCSTVRKNTEFSEITFHDITDLPDAGNKYPFALKMINTKSEEPSYTKLKRKILVSDEVMNPEGKPFYIMHVESSLYCGTRGCFTEFFTANDDSGYSQMPNDWVVGIPVYRKVCSGHLSVVFTGGSGMNSGYGEWRYGDDKFEYYKTSHSLEDAKICH